MSRLRCVCKYLINYVIIPCANIFRIYTETAWKDEIRRIQGNVYEGISKYETFYCSKCGRYYMHTREYQYILRPEEKCVIDGKTFIEHHIVNDGDIEEMWDKMREGIVPETNMFYLSYEDKVGYTKNIDNSIQKYVIERVYDLKNEVICMLK